MIQKQEPKNQNNWLYQILDESTCVFSKLIYLGVGADEWPECSNEFKLKWEMEHPQEELEEDQIFNSNDL